MIVRGTVLASYVLMVTWTCENHGACCNSIRYIHILTCDGRVLLGDGENSVDLHMYGSALWCSAVASDVTYPYTEEEGEKKGC